MPDATERKTLIWCAFVAACVAFAPIEWVSGTVLLGLGVVLSLLDRGITRREEAFVRLLDSWVAPEVATVAPAAGEAAPAAATEAPAAGEVAPEAATEAPAAEPEREESTAPTAEDAPAAAQQGT
jgi:hypothetical protein